MRILTGLAMAALLASAVPAFAQAATETPAPATEAPAAPAAPAPAQDAAPAPEAPAAAPFVRAAVPEGVSEEADKLLWCGHAMSLASTFAKTSGDEEGSKMLLENGGKLIEKGSALLTDLAPEKLDAAKAAYVEQVKVELAGTGENAKFAYQDCMALVQQQ